MRSISVLLSALVVKGGTLTCYRRNFIVGCTMSDGHCGGCRATRRRFNMLDTPLSPCSLCRYIRDRSIDCTALPGRQKTFGKRLSDFAHVGVKSRVLLNSVPIGADDELALSRPALKKDFRLLVLVPIAMKSLIIVYGLENCVSRFHNGVLPAAEVQVGRQSGCFRPPYAQFSSL